LCLLSFILSFFRPFAGRLFYPAYASIYSKDYLTLISGFKLHNFLFVVSEKA
jgi:hypothetical protein